MRSNVKSKQSSITFQSQLRVTLCSHTVFTSHDVRVNKLRLSCHPNSFKGVHNLFIRNAVSFSPPTFASALLALVRLTGTRVPWNPRANPPPPHPHPRALVVTYIYHIIVTRLISCVKPISRSCPWLHQI